MLAISLGCHSESDDVLVVAKQFASAVQRKDIPTILKISEQTRIDRLEKAAERASDQIGGRRQVEVREMLQIVGTNSVFAAETFEVTRIQDDRAKVLVTGVSGESFELDMIRQGGLWRVIIPVPAILNY